MKWIRKVDLLKYGKRWWKKNLLSWIRCGVSETRKWEKKPESKGLQVKWERNKEWWRRRRMRIVSSSSSLSFLFSHPEVQGLNPTTLVQPSPSKFFFNIIENLATNHETFLNPNLQIEGFNRVARIEITWNLKSLHFYNDSVWKNIMKRSSFFLFSLKFTLLKSCFLTLSLLRDGLYYCNILITLS